MTATIRRLTVAETKDYATEKLGLEMSFDYIAHVKASLKKDLVTVWPLLPYI